MADSSPKIAVIVDTEQLQEGVQASVEGLQQMAEQATVTSSTMVTKSQAMAAAAKEAAASVSEADMKMAASTKISVAAKAELAKAMKDVRAGAGSEADAITLLAAAQQKARAASAELAASQKAVTAELAAPMGSGAIGEIGAKLSAMLNPAMLAMAAVAGVGMAMKGAVSSSLDFGEAISRAAAKTNLTAETLSVLHYAAATTGGDFDTMTKGMGMLNVNIAEAANGNKQLGAYFTALGLNAKELATGSDGAQIALQRLAGVLANTEGPEKQLYARKLLSRAGIDQIPTLVELGNHWDEEAQKTKDAGMMMTGPMAAGLASTKERMEEMGQSIDGAKLAFTNGLNQGLDSFLNITGRANGQVSIFTSLGKDMVSMLNGATAAFYKVGQANALVEAHMLGLVSATVKVKALAEAQRDGAAASEALAAAQGKFPTAPASTPEAKDPSKILKPIANPVDASKAAEAVRKASEEKLHAMEEGRLKEEAEGKLGAQADLNYWSARINSFSKGSTEYKAIQEKMQGDTGKLSQSKEAYNAEEAKGAESTAKNTAALALANIQTDLASGKITKLAADNLIAAAHTTEYTAKIAALRTQLAALNADKDASPEDKKTKGAAIQNQIDDAQGQEAVAAAQEQTKAAEATKQAAAAADAAQARLAAATAKSTEITLANAQSFEEGRIKIMEASGALTPLAAVQALAALHTQDHTAKLKILSDELAKLQKIAASAPASTNDAERKASAAKIQELQNQIAELNGQQANQGQQDKASIAANMSKPYTDAFSQINTGWLKVQNDLIQGNHRIGQDFRQMGLGMVQSMAANAEKMLANWAQMEIRKVMLHRVSATQITATDASGSAAAIATSKTTNAATGLQAAELAFKNTYASVSGWPIVGPVLAPVLAAGAFAAVAAFENGGVVGGSSPGMGVHILAHAGERVLSRSETNTFHQILNNGANNGGNTHFHMGGNTIHGGSADSPTVNDKQFTKTVKRLQRGGSLAPARQSILG